MMPIKRTYSRDSSGTFTKQNPKTLKQRFYERVMLPDDNGCMAWIGSKTKGKKDGYGQIVTYLKSPKSIYAHRFSYALHYGAFDSSLHVLHKCDNPVCVAPEHLFLGRAKDNSDDKVRKGRAKGSSRPGQLNPSAKLNNKKVSDIRSLLKDGMKVSVLAKKFKVSGTAIRYIKDNKTWVNIK